MKISFSTLACPEFSWSDIYTMAADLGFNGIEIRGLGDNIFAVKAKPFSKDIEKTKETLKRTGLEIPCLSSGCPLKYKGKSTENRAEIEQYVQLAAKLNTPFIRILADAEPHVTGEVDDDFIISELGVLSETAKVGGVVLLVETNGVYADTKRLRRVLDAVNSPYVAALWDMHHPYRYFGERAEESIKNLGKYLKYVHTKDSVMSGNMPNYRLMGEGDLPIPDMLRALEKSGYDGYISLEWVKRWAGNLEDAGIVFPHFARYMEPWIINKKTLYADERGTGFYPWKKEAFINETFPDVLDRICEEFPDQLAYKYVELDYTRTYREFRDDVDKFAAALIRMGVEKGSHVAIWATNVPQWFITFWAATKIGAVLVTVNTSYKIHEAEYLLRQSDTHTLVMIDGFRDSDYVGIIKEICPELAASKPGGLNSKRLPILKNIVTIDSKQDGCFTWDEAFNLAGDGEAEAAQVRSRRLSLDKNEVCNMQYTSGTTGFPKGVMLTHYNVVNNGKAIGDCLDFSNNDKLMVHVPMFHCFGMVLGMTAAMTHGATIYPITAFSPAKGLKCVHENAITAFHGVPTMFIAMLEHEDFAKTDFSYARTGIMAGSPCPVKVMEDVLNKMNMSEICITYGQTESSPAITMSKTSDSVEQRVNTVGGPIFGVEVKITDPVTGEELPDDTDGELCARGYNIMKGYYKMPEATAAAIDEDGWLHTGDLARRRKEDGYYKITGRIRDMIIRGGENIYPKEIEDFLYTNPKIRDVQVIGVPSKDYGEEIMACIILKDGTEESEELKEEIKAFTVERIAKHKVPKYIDFVTEFPMNAAGKILKYKMREAAVEKLNLQAESQIVTA
ncbi:MAG: AMP-binding protein [Oscillospiraceae bacterium]|jgi:fatty-acyl-CoA synthase|nr:AMP-binding protein [Oscillospiraceae bacterium]